MIRTQLLLKQFNFSIFFIGLVLLLTFFSCKKKKSTIGQNSISSSEIINGFVVDTFSLTTYSEYADSVITSTGSTGLLGSYNDPDFGTVEAAIYTQLRLSSTSPNFGDINSIKIDSLILGLKYEGSYGSLDAQTFEVYELTDTMSLDTYYYSFSDKSISSLNLIDPAFSTMTPDPVSNIYIDTTETEAQLRLKLDTTLAKNLIAEAINNSTNFSSNELFSSYFKGLKINVNNTAQSEGDGAILYFALNDPESKMTIYYTQDGTNKKFDFLINSSAAKFNKVSIVNTGKGVDNVINNNELGSTNFYCQALKSRAIIEIPGIANLPANIIIHEAKLVLPITYSSIYGTGTEVSVATKLEKAHSLYNIGSGVYDESQNAFELDIKSYIQSILSEQRYPVTIDNTNLELLIEGTKIYVYPRYFNSSSDRIIFNGKNSLSGDKPKLTVKYTEF
jgi:hypothetical protein